MDGVNDLFVIFIRKYLILELISSTILKKQIHIKQ